MEPGEEATTKWQGVSAGPQVVPYFFGLASTYTDFCLETRFLPAVEQVRAASLPGGVEILDCLKLDTPSSCCCFTYLGARTTRLSLTQFTRFVSDDLRKRFWPDSIDPEVCVAHILDPRYKDFSFVPEEWEADLLKLLEERFKCAARGAQKDAWGMHGRRRRSQEEGRGKHTSLVGLQAGGGSVRGRATTERHAPSPHSWHRARACRSPCPCRRRLRRR